MKQYHDFLNYILHNGERRSDRTGTGTISTFVPPAMRYNLAHGFPLVTTKKVHWKSVVVELLWMLRGDTNIKYLHDHGVTIWDEWADHYGNLGPVYGRQWRQWPGVYQGSFIPENIDQIKNVIESIKTNPYSRRHIVSAWNPAEVDQMKLPPCHMIFQFYVSQGKLSCHLYQRSADAFLGVPFNIASYALLTHIIAKLTDLEPGEFIHTCGDAHIYLNHLDQVNTQLMRVPRFLPTLALRPSIRTIEEIEWTDCQILDYDPYPAIKAPVAV